MSTVKEKVASLKPNEKFISFEFFPPKTDVGFRNLLARLNRMLALNPLFISVTWGAGGSTSSKSLDLAATCQNDLGLTTVLHLTCTNTNKEIIDNALDQAKKNGIRNILALRGDPPRTQEYWTPNCDFNGAVDLIKYIKEKHGDYFCIGVAGYPEGHVDGAGIAGQDPEKDMPFLSEKMKAGADFIVTQLFYDVDKFISYEKLVRSQPGLEDVIIIPGLMPVTTYHVFTRATKLSHASVPEDIQQRFAPNINNDDEVKRIGFKVLSNIIERIDAEESSKIKGYHFYSLNLEKAVASIVLKSKVLGSVVEAETETVNHDEALLSDDEDSSKPKQDKLSRRSSIVNENELTVNDVLTSALKSIVGKALYNDKKVLIDISTGKGALGKDATWDDFPNGRFGNSNSPAYGEMDGYGALQLNTDEEVRRNWGNPETKEDISKVFLKYLSGLIDTLPWVTGELSPETALIQEQLTDLNQKGWFSLSSQPAVRGYPSSDKIVGWGPANGVVFQKAFVELFIPREEWENDLYPRIKPLLDSRAITYYVGDSSGNIKSNLPVCSKNAITWGVFPLKEVLQPTIIDYESFKAWNEEAFGLWLEWARCYKTSTKSYELLNKVCTDYVLVSFIHHDYMDEFGLWDALLGQ